MSGSEILRVTVFSNTFHYVEHVALQATLELAQAVQRMVVPDKSQQPGQIPVAS
jgi:hypothetical protein